jgi:signal transduction histidine kinase
MVYKGINCHLESFMDISDIKAKELELKHLFDELSESKELIEENLFNRNILVEELANSEEKLRETVAAKDKFFSIIAHDLKSPFAGFLGLTKMMSERINDFSKSELQEFSVAMKDSAINLYKLLENLLEWSRIQRGVTEYNPTTCLLAYYVKENLDLVTESANLKNINLIHLDDDNIKVKADIAMLNTVVRNLISNAIKFTPRNGKIEIGYGIKEDGFCTVFIKDSGVGMDPELLSDLFKLDAKVSRKGTDGEPSTGLGLLLCKEFVEKNGGKIWVESEVGKGSTFYFTLPLESKNDKPYK